ncbi:MAG TPA: hypothetical protein VJ868_00875 [Actinomycetota bacterium]|nr:hypothetical protein [Actinomycetota bacterium]
MTEGLFRRWSVVVALGLTVACRTGAGSPDARREGQPLPLVPIPAMIARECRHADAGRLSCPQLVPRTRSAPRFDVFSPARGHVVFFVEWSGPYPGIVPKNRPPRFAHLVVRRGDLEEGAGFRMPGDEAGVTTIDVSRSRGREAISLGRRDWGGRKGVLVLAPPFPYGIEGDHLMFVWDVEGVDHSVSLHAWRPLTQTEATLRGVVESIP